MNVLGLQLPTRQTPQAATSPEDNQDSPDGDAPWETPNAAITSNIISNSSSFGHVIAMPDFDDACVLALEATMDKLRSERQTKGSPDPSSHDQNKADDEPLSSAMVGNDSIGLNSPKELLQSSPRSQSKGSPSHLRRNSPSNAHSSSAYRNTLDSVDDEEEVEWDMEDVALFAEELHDKDDSLLAVGLVVSDTTAVDMS